MRRSDTSERLLRGARGAGPRRPTPPLCACSAPAGYKAAAAPPGQRLARARGVGATWCRQERPPRRQVTHRLRAPSPGSASGGERPAALRADSVMPWLPRRRGGVHRAAESRGKAGGLAGASWPHSREQPVETVRAGVPAMARGQEWSRGDLGETASFPPGMLWIWKNNDLGCKVKLGC